MESHFKLSDEHFEQQFKDMTLDPVLFSHEAHLRLAWIHINNYGIAQATTNICIQIKRFANFHGDPDKFNMTLTVAAVRAVYHFMLRSESKTFASLLQEFPRLKNNFKGLMGHHYSFDIFSDPKAKNTFLEPDLLAFD